MWCIFLSLFSSIWRTTIYSRLEPLTDAHVLCRCCIARYAVFLRSVTCLHSPSNLPDLVLPRRGGSIFLAQYTIFVFREFHLSLVVSYLFSCSRDSKAAFNACWIVLSVTEYVLSRGQNIKKWVKNMPKVRSLKLSVIWIRTAAYGVSHDLLIRSDNFLGSSHDLFILSYKFLVLSKNLLVSSDFISIYLNQKIKGTNQ